jgi:hypothetical protein
MAVLEVPGQIATGEPHPEDIALRGFEEKRYGLLLFHDVLRSGS